MLECLRKISASLNGAFKDDEARMMPGSEKDKIMKFMTEQGAFYNISQVFNFVQRRSGSGRNNDGQSWSQIEFEVLTLCFNLFQY